MSSYTQKYRHKKEFSVTQTQNLPSEAPVIKLWLLFLSVGESLNFGVLLSHLA